MEITSEKAIQLLKTQIEKIKKLELYSKDSSNVEFKKWHSTTQNYIQAIYGSSSYLDEWHSRLFFCPCSGYDDDGNENYEYYIQGLLEAQAQLESIVDTIIEIGILQENKSNNMALKPQTIVNVNTNNSNSTNINIEIKSLSEIINNIKNSQYMPDAFKKEAEEKLQELDAELNQAEPRWEKIKEIGSWAWEQGKDIGIGILSNILKSYLPIE